MADGGQQIVQQILAGNVLQLWIDTPPVNALGHALRVSLAQGIARAADDPEIAAIVLLSHGRMFSAGADISEFGKPRQHPVLSDLCNLVEACPKPVIAALHEAALGGGLELALAAHYRIAVPGTRLALPEVTLGILPGAGGTQRLPRLVGAEAALQMILWNRPLFARKALELGLLDRITPENLEVSAIAFAQEVAARPLRPTRDRRDGFSDPAGYAAAVAQARAKARNTALPAPGRIVDCIEAAQLLPFDQGLAFEHAVFADLVASPQAEALRYLFFAERNAAKVPRPDAVPRRVRSVTVLGVSDDAINLVDLLLGIGVEVVLAEKSRAALAPGLERVVQRLDHAVAKGEISGAEKDRRWDLLSADLSGDMETLGDMLFLAGDFADPDANLPDLPASALMPVVTLGRRGPGGSMGLGLMLETDSLTGAHPRQPKLVELIASQGNAPEAVATALLLLRRMRLTIVQVVDKPVGTKLIRALRSALLLVEDQQGAEPVLELLQRWGMEADGPTGARPGPDLFSGVAGRVLGAVANAGFRLLGEGRARCPADIDLIFCTATGFPRWGGGPMHWAARRGLLVLRQDLLHWASDAPGLFTPAPMLDELIRTGLSLAALNTDAGG